LVPLFVKKRCFYYCVYKMDKSNAIRVGRQNVNRRVRIRNTGMHLHPEMNGRVGVIVNYHDYSDMYRVLFDGIPPVVLNFSEDSFDFVDAFTGRKNSRKYKKSRKYTKKRQSRK
jgi:hypothetical protein